MAECPTCGRGFDSEKGMNVHHTKAHSQSIAGVEAECERCGDTYRVKPYKEDTTRFCSRECQHGNRAELTCEACGGRYTVQSYREEISRFCSIHCKARWQSENPANPNPRAGSGELVPCDQCDEEFYAARWEVRQGRRFCSDGCYKSWHSENIVGEDHPDWDGGRLPYGPGFNAGEKETIRERDGRECRHCGRPEKEHVELFGCKHAVHHIIPAREFDDPEKRNAGRNLITLCRYGCHQLWEQMAPLRPDIGTTTD